MPEPIKISRIFSPEDAIAHAKEYGHLFEVLQPPSDLANFKPKDGFPAGGTLLVGDLVCNDTLTTNLEVHPFPEWVLQSPRYGKHPSKVYAIFANVDPKFFERKIARKDWIGRVQAYNEYLKALPIDSVFAIEMPFGVIVKVCKNAPHYFLSAPSSGEDFPYLVVFEPNIPVVAEDLKAATAYFSLSNPLKI